MGNTSIEWCEKVWNPVTGCSKVSAGCKNCYAERIFHRPYPGRDFTDVRCHPERLEQPLHWKKPARIFVNSMSDLFHEKVPASFIVDCFEVMAAAKKHTYLILTKRPERISPVLFGEEGNFYLGGGDFYPHILLGVSVEDQKTADERIPKLLSVGWMGKTFVSYEPALGPVDFETGRKWLRTLRVKSPDPNQLPDYIRPRIDWVVCGGENGPNARPMHPDWARSARNQCAAAEVPFFFKQWGEWVRAEDPVEAGDVFVTREAEYSLEPLQISCRMRRVGKKWAGRLLDGLTWDEFPEVKP